MQPDIDLDSKSPNLDGTVVEDNSTVDLNLCASAKKFRTANWSEADGSDLPTQGGFIVIDQIFYLNFYHQT